MNHVDIESDRKGAVTAGTDRGDSGPVDRHLSEQHLQRIHRDPVLHHSTDRDCQPALRAGLRSGDAEDADRRIRSLPDSAYRKLVDREDHTAVLHDR